MSFIDSKIGPGFGGSNIESLMQRIETCHEDLSADELGFVLDVISHLSLEKESLASLRNFHQRIQAKVELLDLQQKGEGRENFNLKTLALKVDELIHSSDGDVLADLFFENPDAFARALSQIKDSVKRLEIARKCALKDKQEVCERIQEFGLQTAEEKREVAILCIEVGFDDFIFLLENFQINASPTEEGDYALREIILRYIELHPGNEAGIIEVIQDLQIASQEIRFEIARICIKDKRMFVDYFQNFALTDEQLIEIVGENKENFTPIEVIILLKKMKTSPSLESKVKMILLFVDNHPHTILNHLNSFKLKETEEGRKKFIQTVELVVKKHGMKIYRNMSSLFEDLEQVRHFESMCLKPHIYISGEALREYANRVGFKSDEERNEAVFRCAEKSPLEIINFVGELEGLSQSQHQQLLEIYIKHAPDTFPRYIKRFKLEEKIRLKYALSRVLNLEHPSDFDVSDFLLVATKPIFDFVRAFLIEGHSVPKNIFEILFDKSEKFQKQRQDFFFKAAILDPATLLGPLQSLEGDQFVILQVIETAILKLLDKPILFFKDLNLSFEIKEKIILRAYLSKFLNFSLDDLERKEFEDHIFPEILAQMESSKGLALKLFQEAKSLGKGGGFQFKRAVCMAYMSINSLGDHIEDPAIYETILKMIKYRNGCIALSLLVALSSNLSDVQLSCFHQVISSPGRGGKVEVKNNLLLAMIYLSNWATNSPLDKSIKMLIDIQQVLNSKLIRAIFKDRASNLEQMWLGTCVRLNDDIRISPQRKIELLEYACKGLDSKNPAADLYKRLSLLSALVSSGASDYLNQDFPKKLSATQFLSNGLIENLKKDTYVDLGEVEDLEEKYLKTLDKLRVPNAWKTLAIAYRQVQSEALREAYNKFILSVLHECSEVGAGNRYEDLGEEKTPHIHQICVKHKEVWETWKEVDPPTPMTLKVHAAEIDKLRDYLAEQFRVDGFDLEEIKTSLPHLVLYLEKKASLGDLLKKEGLSDVEKELLNLMNSVLNQKEMATRLKKVIKALQTGQQLPFLMRLQEYYHLCKQAPKTYELERFVSGDWQDLLLCGTEVSGSCQSVSATPDLNKGLIGYLIDGKNKVIVLKDKESGKIIARAVLRVMWDESIVNEDKTKGGPALFLDKPYPKPCPKELSQALNEGAISKAKAMGLRLYVGEERKGCEKSGGKIHSLKGPAPFEYADGALYLYDGTEEHVGGVMEDGEYQIANPHLVLETKS